MSNLFWLTDEQMARLQPYFPKSHGRPRVDDGDIAHIDMRLSSARCDRHDQGRVLIRVGDDTAREGLRFERAAGPDREGDVATSGAAHVLRPAEGQGHTQCDDDGRPGARRLGLALSGTER